MSYRKKFLTELLSSGYIVLILVSFLVISSIYSGLKDYQYERAIALQQEYISDRINNNLIQLKICFENQDETCNFWLSTTETQLGLLINPNRKYKQLYSYVKRYVLIKDADSSESLQTVLEVAKINGEIPKSTEDSENAKTILKNKYFQEVQKLRPQKLSILHKQ